MCSYVALNVFYDANHKSAQKYGLHENPKFLKIDVLRVFFDEENVFFTFKSAQRAYHSTSTNFSYSVYYLGAFNGEFRLLGQ